MVPLSVVFVGIHVRRGDFLKPELQDFGYTVATKLYLQRAMEYFTTKYNPIHFIVASDDIQWCRENFKHYKNVWIPTQKHSAELDMALLIQCNHTIVSTGMITLYS